MIIINKLEEKGIYVKDKNTYPEGEILSASYDVGTDYKNGMIILTSKIDTHKTITGKWDDFFVNGENPVSLEEVAKELISFIGNFKRGGSSSGNNGGGVTIHNQLSGRSAKDCHPISSITGLEESLNKQVEDVTVPEIKQLFGETGETWTTVLGVDKNNKLYLSKYGKGTGYIEDGKYIQISNSFFTSASLGQDGKLYFMNYWGTAYVHRLNDDNSLSLQHAATCRHAAIGGDGKLYFIGVSGLIYLDNDGITKTLSVPPGLASSGTFVIAGNNKTYLLSYNGIWYIDHSDGTIKQTNVIYGSFMFATKAPNGRLYFCSNDGYGIYYLDNDGDIKQTNKKNLDFFTAAIAPNGKLYFGGNGIYYLDNDGLIKNADSSYDSYSFAHFISTGNEIYLLPLNNKGILVLDENGNVAKTNKSSGYFNSAIMCKRKIYFGTGEYGVNGTPGSASGIWYLDSQILGRTNGEWQNIEISDIIGLESRLANIELKLKSLEQ